MSFDPEPNEKLELFGDQFVVLPHPDVKGIKMAYAQEGSRGTVFKVRTGTGDDFALKVFKPQYRDVQPEIARHLARYRELPGLRAAHRRVIPAGSSWPALEKAVVMPWIGGKTWFDVLRRIRKDHEHIMVDAAIHLCHRLLGSLRSLEACGAAHTDIAAGNVVIDLDSLEIQLVDLEELFAPDLPPPPIAGRTAGYTRDGLTVAGGFWSAEGDRFAGVIMAAEILALSNPDLARTAYGDSFFDPATIGATNAAQFRPVMDYLQSLTPDFAVLFARAWTATRLTDCATIAQCASTIEPLVGDHPLSRAEFFVRSPRAIVIPGSDDDDARRRQIVVGWNTLSVPQPERPRPRATPPPIPRSPRPTPPQPVQLSPPPRDVASWFWMAVLCLIMIAIIASAVHSY